jgi:hypothetical protein
MKAHRGVEYSFILSLTLALDRVAGQQHVTAALLPGMRPGTHFTRGWVDPWMVWTGVKNLAPLPEFDPRTVQPVTSRYTDCAIPAPTS